MERADNRRVNKEQGGNEINIETLSDFEANNGDASGNSSFDEAVNGDPFVPKKTLPRTPPQRRSPIPSRTEISILPPEEVNFHIVFGNIVGNLGGFYWRFMFYEIILYW